MDADKNNIDELNKTVPENLDISYGGCRYRLSYDRYENPCRKKMAVKVSSVLLTLGLVAVFVALGFLILRYYNSGVTDYYDKSVSDDAVTASFQSFLPHDGGH